MNNIPKTLYKYRNWGDNYHKRLLTDFEIFLASPANLNDPFDASLPFRYDPVEMTPENITRKLLEQGREIWKDISEEELHRRAYQQQQTGQFDSDEYWKDQHENHKAAIHRTFGLLSLTNQNDNLLMWAHYANCHKGFCVGLDRDILYESIGGGIGPVIYSDNFPLMPLFPKGTEGIETIVRILNTKSRHWAYEEEFRITKSQAANKVFTLPPEGITEVVLGCNMSAEDRHSIIEVIDSKLRHVQIIEARTNLYSFKLDLNSTVPIKANLAQ